jgi:hypothetical protein
MSFRGSIAPPARPLSTLRCALAGRQRMTRGQRDWLDLRCRALSSPAPCRFIPTLSPINHHVTGQEPTLVADRSKPGRPRTHDPNPPTRPRPATEPTRGGLDRTDSTSKQGRRTGCSRRPSPDEAACLAVGDEQVAWSPRPRDLLPSRHRHPRWVLCGGACTPQYQEHARRPRLGRDCFTPEGIST